MSRVTGDFLRLLSIAFVLVIHGTGWWERRFHAAQFTGVEDVIAVFLNQLARFSVPTFVFLSGLGLTLKYANRERVASPAFSSRALGGFFSERAYKIGLPFLVWTLVFFALMRISWSALFAMAPAAAFEKFFVTLWPYLYRTGADYHFYFFHIIIECYILFPLLLRITVATGLRGRLLLWTLFFAMQLILSSPGPRIFDWIGLERPRFFSAFFPNWSFYFVSGMLVALYQDSIRAWLAARRWQALFLWAGFYAAVVVEYIYWSYRQPGPDYYNHFTRHTVVGFTLTTLALFLAFDAPIRAWFETRPRAFAWMNIGAALSFAVYIFHTWILRGLFAAWSAPELFALLGLLFALSFGFALVLDRWIGAPAWLRVMFGLPEARVVPATAAPRST